MIKNHCHRFVAALGMRPDGGSYDGAMCIATCDARVAYKPGRVSQGASGLDSLDPFQYRFYIYKRGITLCRLHDATKHRPSCPAMPAG
jgi:hypothetical protein